MKDRRRLILCLLSLFICSQAATGQNAPPSTDIFLLDIVSSGGTIKAGNPRNITSRAGYDNQPSFGDEGIILFTSIREDNQADIYSYIIRNGATSRVTQTKESEYSPTRMPGGRYISVVRVEADSTQRLWRFGGGNEPALILENVKPVGYHAWLDENTLALFVLGSPNTLQTADTRTGKAEIMASNIGRSLHKRPGSEKLTFVHKVSEKEWVIKELDIRSRKETPLIKTVAGSEDFAWTPDGSIIMAGGSKLFRYDPRRDKDWQEFADFSSAGLKGITRLAINPRGSLLALVASEGK
jgi:hypothetical protein